MWQALIAPIAGLLTKGLDVVDKLVPDKDLAAKIKAELAAQINNILHTEVLELLKAQSSIIIAEAQGESWLQRNWRPLLMMLFGCIVANNYVIAPYLSMLVGPEAKLILEVPPDMWSLLKLGVSGYVVGRSVEKIADGAGLSGAWSKVKNGSVQ